MAANEVETWESNSEGRVSLNVPNGRGGLQTLSTLGKGQRLRIKTSDRIIVEEGVRDEQNNPFINGALWQVGGPLREPVSEEEGLKDQQLSDEDLAVFFTLEPKDFEAGLEELSKVNVYRLNTLVRDKAGTVVQSEILREFIEKKWPVSSGDTAAYREMRQEPVR